MRRQKFQKLCPMICLVFLAVASVSFSLPSTSAALTYSPDQYEANNSIAANKTLSTGVIDDLSLSDVHDTWDYYRCLVSGGNIFTIIITTPDSPEVTSLSLYIQNGTLDYLYFDGSHGVGKSFRVDVGVAQYIYIRVGVGTNGPFNYTMSLAIAASSYSPDAHEPNNDQSTAASVGFGLLQGLTASFGRDVDDWFNFTGTAGQRIKVEVTSNRLVTMQILVHVGAETYWYQLKNHLRGRLELDINVTRVYSLQINAMKEVAVTYNTTLSTSALGYVQDGYERNNERESATIITPGIYTGLTLSYSLDNADWFNFTAPVDNIIEISVTANAPDWAIDVGLYIPDGSPVSKLLVNRAVHIWHPTTVSGSYSVSIATYNAMSLNYTLTVSYQPNSYAADTFESNDDPSEAKDLTPNSSNVFTMDAAKDPVDYFNVTMPAGRWLEVIVDAIAWDGELGLVIDLFDPVSGYQLAPSRFAADPTRPAKLRHPIATAGEYTIVISTETSYEVTYMLNITITTAQAATLDWVGVRPGEIYRWSYTEKTTKYMDSLSLGNFILANVIETGTYEIEIKGVVVAPYVVTISIWYTQRLANGTIVDSSDWEYDVDQEGKVPHVGSFMSPFAFNIVGRQFDFNTAIPGSMWVDLSSATEFVPSGKSWTLGAFLPHANPTAKYVYYNHAFSLDGILQNCTFLEYSTDWFDARFVENSIVFTFLEKVSPAGDDPIDYTGLIIGIVIAGAAAGVVLVLYFLKKKKIILQKRPLIQARTNFDSKV